MVEPLSRTRRHPRQGAKFDENGAWLTRFEARPRSHQGAGAKLSSPPAPVGGNASQGGARFINPVVGGAGEIRPMRLAPPSTPSAQGNGTALTAGQRSASTAPTGTVHAAALSGGYSSGGASMTVSGTTIHPTEGGLPDNGGYSGGGSQSSLNAASTPLQLTEGVSSGTVTAATFTDADPNAQAGDFTAMIDWGDGTPAVSGTVGGSAGNFTVAGSHTYPEASGTMSGGGNSSAPAYPITVTIRDENQSTITASNFATVAPVPLTGTAVNFNATEGVAFNTTTIATFTDPDGSSPADPIGSQVATIDWGDGSTPTTTSYGNFSSNTQIVTGGHTYPAPGTYTVTTTMAGSGVATTVLGTATVADQPLSAGNLVVTTAPEGSGTTATASFYEPYVGDTTADFTATIDWGDGKSENDPIALVSGGSSSGGMSSGGGSTPSLFNTSGVHFYTQPGTYTVTATIRDGIGSPITQSQQIQVVDAALSASGASFNATQGVPFSGVTIATFTDANPGDGPQVDLPQSNYSALVSWGDNTPPDSTALVSGANGSFVLAGSHTFTASGTFTVTATIGDDGGSTRTVTGTATVAATTMTVAGATVAAVQGGPATNLTVATFTDTNPSPAGSYAATINWGDGTAQTRGVVATNPSGPGFVVSGSHSFALGGTLPVTVTLTDPRTMTPVAVTSTANVSEPSPTVYGNLTINATSGSPVSGVTVATFTGAPSNYRAYIDWGDSTGVEVGTITPEGSSYTVTGQHTYASSGSFPVKALIFDGAGNAFTASDTAAVAPPPLVASGTTTLSPVAGAALNNVVVATLTDPGIPASGLAATIDWGDGSATTTATITAAPSGVGFNVIGSHAYTDAGTDTITASVSDTSGRSDIAYTNVTVADAALTAAAANVSAIEATPFNGIVATLTDANPNDAPGNFSVTINWGDGSAPDIGTVAANPSGPGLIVTGAHTYLEENAASAIQVAVKNPDQTVSVSATSPVVVADAALTATGAVLSPTAGVTMNSITVAQFRDANPSDLAGAFTASINWGDGTSPTTGVVAGGYGTFSVSGTHNYPVEGTSSPRVTITDQGGASIIATGQAQVTAALYTVARVWGGSGSYTAMINWGDGTAQSSGQIVTDPQGGYDVKGTHVYAEAGSNPSPSWTTVISVTDNAGGPQQQATGMAYLADAPLMAGQALAQAPPRPAAPARVQGQVKLSIDGLPDELRAKPTGRLLLIHDDFARIRVTDANPTVLMPGFMQDTILGDDPRLVTMHLTVGPAGTKGTLSWSIGAQVSVWRQLADKSFVQVPATEKIVATGGNMDFKVEGIKIGSGSISVTFTPAGGIAATQKANLTVYSGLSVIGQAPQVAQLVQEIAAATGTMLSADAAGNVFVTGKLTKPKVTAWQLAAYRQFLVVQGNLDTSKGIGTTVVQATANDNVPIAAPLLAIDPGDIAVIQGESGKVAAAILLHEMREKFEMQIKLRPLRDELANGKIVTGAHTVGLTAEKAIIGLSRSREEAGFVMGVDPNRPGAPYWHVHFQWGTPWEIDLEFLSQIDAPGVRFQGTAIVPMPAIGVDPAKPKTITTQP